MLKLTNILKNIVGRKILVVGDVMLDRFVYGSVDRVSPEAPVPVLKITRETAMLGGAGNVAANIVSLGAVPILCSTIGDDESSHALLRAAEEAGVDAKGLLRDPARVTILKTRYLAQNQQLLRTDAETVQDMDVDMEDKFLSFVTSALKEASAVILSDYGKGVLSPRVVQTIIKDAKSRNIPVLVDPKKTDYAFYRGANVVTPNRKELAVAIGSRALKSDDDIVQAAQSIINQCGIESVVATRSEDGLSVISSSTSPLHIRTETREVYDVSGAGDTVIAVLAAALATGASLEDSARLANIAGGIAVSKVGTTSVQAEDIESHLRGGASTRQFQARLAGWTDAAEQVRQWQAKGLRVGMTCGCFDILHYGHVNYLNEARGQCDRLVVAINHDASVRLLKGPTRPVNDETARATVLGALGSVDMVVLFGAEKAGEDNTPSLLIDALRPDIFFKGGDYTEDQLPEAKIIRAYGGNISIMALHEGYSTTNIIGKSAKLANG